MASLKLEHIYKVYPNGTKAVNDISLDIQNGEFIVFVGPSGCGKSTTLRMIAGLEEITAGELYIDNRIVNDVEPKDRDIAMVFQNYALYPHMSVYENMAFGLKLRHVPDDVIQEKVLWASEILGIKEYLDRKPRNMSGGQRQRVALGRAILRDPKVMLLDEPLSNLDAKLRTQMRTEIAKLHKKLKTTFIYVTHDQTEAMTLGDRVVVMKQGRIQQVDTPKNLYDYPSNVFVAGFIGTPQMNFFNGTLLRDGENVLVHLDENGQDLTISYNSLIKVDPAYLDGRHPVVIGVRCEHVHVVPKDTAGAIPVHVSHFEELGADCLVYGSIGNDSENIHDNKGQIIIKVTTIDDAVKAGEDIYVTFDMDHTYFFDAKTEETIVPRIPKENNVECDVVANTLSFLGTSLPLPSAIQVDDVRDALLHVPTDAILLGKGALRAKVVANEHIGKTTLVHLLLGNRILFAIGEDQEVGAEIAIDFDKTRLSIEKDGKKIVTPLKAYDEFLALFYNYKTVLSQKQDQSFVDYRDSKLAAAENFFNAKILLENQEYEKKKLAIQDGHLQNEVPSYLEKIQRNGEEIRKIQQKAKQDLKELKAQFLIDKKKATDENRKLFAEKKAKEVEDYRNFRASNKDKEALRRRSDEYHIFMDNFATDRDNAIQLAVNGITMDYESKSSTVKAAHRREIEILKKENKECRKKIRVAKNPMKYLDKDHETKLRALERAKKEQMERAGMVFFFLFPGAYYCLTGDVIANKLIQGLGTRVFTKEFLVELPHDAYKIVEEGKGLKVQVAKNLDYDGRLYAECAYADDKGHKGTLYVQVAKPLAEGSFVSVSFAIEKARITETDMNIRLY